MPRKKKEAPNRADNRYEVKITVGTRPDGSLIRKSFYSTISKADAKKQADKWKIQHEAEEMINGKTIAPDVKLKVLAKEFLSLKENDSNLKEYSFITTYETAMNKHIVPYFGNSYVRQIKSIDIDNFFAQHSHMSQSMLNKFKLCLRGIFELALENEVITKSPMPSRMKSQGVKPKTKAIYSLEDRKKIIDYCIENNIIAPVLLLELAIRRSELLGLKWEDIDEENCCIHIQRGVTPTRHSFAVGDTKSETSNRVIPCTEGLMQFLKNNKETGFILKGNLGGAMPPSSFGHYYKVIMTEVCQKLNIPYLPPHNLRHTVGSLMHQGGTDIYTISKYLGHSDIGITSKTYVKTNVEALRKNIKY